MRPDTDVRSRQTSKRPPTEYLIRAFFVQDVGPDEYFTRWNLCSNITLLLYIFYSIDLLNTSHPQSKISHHTSNQVSSKLNRIQRIHHLRTKRLDASTAFGLKAAKREKLDRGTHPAFSKSRRRANPTRKGSLRLLTCFLRVVAHRLES